MSVQEKIAATIGKSTEHSEDAASATTQLAKDTRRHRQIDDQRRQITQIREIKQRRQVISSWKKTNDLLKKIADGGAGLLPWNRQGGLLGAGGNILKLGGLGALMGARGLTNLATKLPVIGPAIKRLPAGFKPTSAIPNVGGRILNVGGRLLAGGAGAALGVVGLKQGYDSIRAKQGQSFFGMNEGEGGLLDSRASDYLLNAGTGALSGAAIGSAIPVVGTAVGAVVGGLTGIVTSVYADFKEQIDGWFASVGDFIKNADWKKIGQMAGEGFKALLGMIWEGVKQLPGILWDIGKNVIGFIGEWTPVVFSSLGNFFLGVFDSFTGGLGTSLATGLDNAGKWVAGMAGDVWDWMSGVGDAVWNWVTGLLDAAWELIPGQSKAARAKDLFNNIVSGKDTNLADDELKILVAARDHALGQIADAKGFIATYDAMKASGQDVSAYAQSYKDIQAAILQVDGVVAKLDGEINNRKQAAGLIVGPRPADPAPAATTASTGPRSAAATSLVQSTGEYHVRAAAAAQGVNVDAMMAIAKRESNFIPDAANPNSKARGLFQFMPGTWDEMYAKHGARLGLVNDRMNAKSNATLGALLIKENSDYLRSKLGREPTTQEIYYAHFMGAGKAYEFIKGLEANPNAISAGFWGDKAISQNNGLIGNNMTYAQQASNLSIKPYLGSESATMSAAAPPSIDAVSIPRTPGMVDPVVNVNIPPPPRPPAPTPASPPRLDPSEVPMDDIGFAIANGAY